MEPGKMELLGRFRPVDNSPYHQKSGPESAKRWFWKIESNGCARAGIAIFVCSNGGPEVISFADKPGVGMRVHHAGGVFGSCLLLRWSLPELYCNLPCHSWPNCLIPWKPFTASRYQTGRPILIFFGVVALRISGERYFLCEGLGIVEESNRSGSGSATFGESFTARARFKTWRNGARTQSDASEGDCGKDSKGVQGRFTGGAQRIVHCSSSCGAQEISKYCRSGCRPYPALWRHLAGGSGPVELSPCSIRIQFGHERENYGRTYGEAQRIIAAEVPARFDARTVWSKYSKRLKL